MDENPNTIIWQRINNLIKQKNFTQVSLSELCGFNSRRIQNLSGGNRLPDAIEFFKIAQTLNTSIEYLLTGKEPSIPQDVLDLARDILSLPPALQNVIRSNVEQFKAMAKKQPL